MAIPEATGLLFLGYFPRWDLQYKTIHGSNIEERE